MNKTVLGAVLALLLVGVGTFWWQGRAQTETAPPPPKASVVTVATDSLPSADAADMVGPTPPEASDLTREQKRFFRYDKNRDRKITRVEMLATRSDAFRKLDKDGNNLLTFEEWAVATSNRFAGADANRDGELSPAEFAATAPKPAKKPACKC